jgi:hypothetical protein
MDGGPETPDEAVAAVGDELAREQQADAEKEAQRAGSWINRFPGQKMNRRAEAAWAEDGKFPAEEAEQTARTAAGVAQAADADRAAIDAEVHELDATQPGSALDQEAHAIAQEAAGLAADAESAGFAVSQDALNAEGFAHHHLQDPAQAAEDQAQTDLHRAAHDLALEDQLRSELEGDTKAGRAGAAPSPLPPPPSSPGAPPSQ